MKTVAAILYGNIYISDQWDLYGDQIENFCCKTLQIIEYMHCWIKMKAILLRNTLFQFLFIIVLFNV